MNTLNKFLGEFARRDLVSSSTIFIPPINRALDDCLGDFVRRASPFLNVNYFLTTTASATTTTNASAVEAIATIANTNANGITLSVFQQPIVAVTTAPMASVSTVISTNVVVSTIVQHPHVSIAAITAATTCTIPRYIELNASRSLTSVVHSSFAVAMTSANHASDNILINNLYDPDFADILSDATMVVDHSSANTLTQQQIEDIVNSVPVGSVNFVTVCTTIAVEPSNLVCTIPTTSVLYMPSSSSVSVISDIEKRYDTNTFTTPAITASRVSSVDHPPLLIAYMSAEQNV